MTIAVYLGTFESSYKCTCGYYQRFDQKMHDSVKVMPVRFLQVG